MKKKLLLIFILAQVIYLAAYSQEKSKKQQKEEEQAQKKMQIENLVNSKNFVFKARYAFPMGARQIDLTSNPNYVKFNPDLMDGYMPYFGTATAGIGLSGDATIKFKDKPDKFNIEEKKKNFQVDAEVKGVNDVYRISLTVTFSGSSSMTVTSNHRGTISYQGEIYPGESIKY